MSATTDRVERALSEHLSVERVRGGPGMFRVYSGSGARYIVELATGAPDCTCEDWQRDQRSCMHVLRVLVMYPAELNEVV
jgi:glucokinase